MAQAIRDELIEELLQGYHSPQDLLGEEGLFKELKKRLLVLRSKRMIHGRSAQYRLPGRSRADALNHLTESEHTRRQTGRRNEHVFGSA